ncbi:hypothetical protein ACOME3_007610 [Neoechinorhynchus agilis]
MAINVPLTYAQFNDAKRLKQSQTELNDIDLRTLKEADKKTDPDMAFHRMLMNRSQTEKMEVLRKRNVHPSRLITYSVFMGSPWISFTWSLHYWLYKERLFSAQQHLLPSCR